jgi:hypothetical protein
MAQVDSTQDQGAQSTSPQPQSQGTPWDQDLAFIEDETTRSQVSDYLGKKVQPYVTQLEQRAKPALEFYNDFQEEPGATTLGVIEELYGPDAAKTFAGYLTEQFGEGHEPPEEQQHEAQSYDDPRLQRMLESWEQQEQEREWSDALKELQEAHKDIEIDDLLFRPFAAMADGDLEQALVGYRNFFATAKEKLGIQPAPPAEDDGFSQAPPALGTTGGTAVPPVEPTGQSIGDAISDWVNDLKAQGQTVAPPHPGS